MPKDTLNKHPCHQPELAKLNRIAGQIEGVKKMIEAQRYCPDIITQLRAARAAIRTVEANILETHLNSCVAEAMKSNNKKETDAKIAELKNLFKRFDEL